MLLSRFVTFPYPALLVLVDMNQYRQKGIVMQLL